RDRLLLEGFQVPQADHSFDAGRGERLAVGMVGAAARIMSMAAHLSERLACLDIDKVDDAVARSGRRQPLAVGRPGQRRYVTLAALPEAVHLACLDVPEADPGVEA